MEHRVLCLWAAPGDARGLACWCRVAVVGGWGAVLQGSAGLRQARGSWRTVTGRSLGAAVLPYFFLGVDDIYQRQSVVVGRSLIAYDQPRAKNSSLSRVLHPGEVHKNRTVSVRLMLEVELAASCRT
jgi:hypothetical protein